jgi:hypothetical protein
MHVLIFLEGCRTRGRVLRSVTNEQEAVPIKLQTLELLPVLADKTSPPLSSQTNSIS